MDATRTKVCRSCGEERAVELFSVDRRARDGLQSRCKACNKAYHYANRDRIVERKRQYHAEHSDEAAAKWKARQTPESRAAKATYDKAYVAKNADRIKAQHAEYRAENAAAINERKRARRAAAPDVDRARDRARSGRESARRVEAARRWRERNPDRARDVARLADRRRRARKAAAQVDTWTADQEVARRSMFAGCYICGIAFGDVSVHLDHVKPLAKGGAHLLSNLRPACDMCNLRKADRWPFDPAQIAAESLRAREAAAA